MCLQMGMKEDNDEVTTKTRILSLELLQVSSADLSAHRKLVLVVRREEKLFFLSLYFNDLGFSVMLIVLETICLSILYIRKAMI